MHLKKTCRFWSSLKSRFLIEKASQLTHDRWYIILFVANKDDHCFLLTNAENFQIAVFLFSHALLWYSLYIIFIALQTANHSRRCLCPHQMQERGSTEFDVWSAVWEHNGNLSPAVLWHIQLNWYKLPLIYHQSSNENSADNTYFEFFSGCYKATSAVVTFTWN